MTVVDEFFDAHGARLGFNPDSVDRDPSERGGLDLLHRVARPGLNMDFVSAELERCGFGTGNTDVYQSFLCTASYRALDCDGVVEFATTASTASWLLDVTRFRGGLDPAKFFAFGFDPATSAVFCLHRMGRVAEPIVSIVDQGAVYTGVFSSFSALLQIVTRVLLSDVVLFVGRGSDATAEQRELVAALCALDPDGFGRVGWPEWYRRAVGADWA